MSAAVLGSAHVKREIQIRKRLLSSGDSDVTLNCDEWSGLISPALVPNVTHPSTSLTDVGPFLQNSKKHSATIFHFLKYFLCLFVELNGGERASERDKT